MDEKKLEFFINKKDPLRFPISICLTKSELMRWKILREKIKRKKRGASLAHFARLNLIEMMNEVEKLLDEDETTATTL